MSQAEAKEDEDAVEVVRFKVSGKDIVDMCCAPFPAISIVYLLLLLSHDVMTS